MITVTLLASNRLFLSHFEVERLTETVRQQLTCRTANEADEPLIVADVFLTVAEAWQLLDRLTDCLRMGEVDWAVEGF